MSKNQYWIVEWWSGFGLLPHERGKIRVNARGRQDALNKAYKSQKSKNKSTLFLNAHPEK